MNTFSVNVKITLKYCTIIERVASCHIPYLPCTHALRRSPWAQQHKRQKPFLLKHFSMENFSIELSVIYLFLRNSPKIKTVK